MMGRIVHRAEKTAQPKPARFEVYGDAGGGFRWRLKAGNGEILAASSEAYTRRYDANRGLRAAKTAMMEAI